MGNSWADPGDCCWSGVPLHAQRDSPSPPVTAVCGCGARAQLGRVFLEAHCPLCKVRLSSQHPRVPTRCSACECHGDNTHVLMHPWLRSPHVLCCSLRGLDTASCQSANDATAVTALPGSRCNRRRLQGYEKPGAFLSVFLVTEFILHDWEGGLMN